MTKLMSNTVGSYPLKPLTKNKERISLCQFKTIPLKFLVGATVNRTKIEKHITLMMSKIRENGLLDAIKVFDTSIVSNPLTPVYESAEGAYRIEALKRLFGHNSDELIPCLILPEEYNIDDAEQTLETIVGLNKDNRPWVLEDYIKSWTKTGRYEYKTLYNLIQKYAKPPTDKNLSVAQVSYIFVGGRSTQNIKALKSGKFKTNTDYERFCNHLLETLNDWVKEWGSKKLGLHKTYSTYLFNEISKVVTNQLPVVENKQDLFDWIDKLLLKYLKILETHFENQSNKPLSKRKPLPGLSADLISEWEFNFKKFVKEHPVPQVKTKPTGIDKFITHKTQAVA